MNCKKEICWCHDESASCPVFCDHCGCFRKATQEELRTYCIEVLGMSEGSIGEGEIPQGVLLVSPRPLTPAEEKMGSEPVKV